MKMKRKIVFIDRDGVICEERKFLKSCDEVKLISGSAEGIKLLNDSGCKVIVITNQPVVARGFCSADKVRDIHFYLNNLIRDKSGGMIDSFYFCPHHPTAGDNPRYTRVCECRKPKPGMINKALDDYGVDELDLCFMIGDKIGDIKAGRDAGCRTILVETGYGGKEKWNDAVPDHREKNLLHAIKNIILEK